MQLYFIRHGQSANNKIWQDNGNAQGRHEDPPLTSVGEQQAEHVARFLAGPHVAHVNGKPDVQNVAGFDITHVYCSLHVRAVQTATPIARALGLPLVAWPEIHEEDGIYIDDEQGKRSSRPGKTRSYFEQHFPHLQLPAWLDERGWWNGRPSEEAADMNTRAAACLKELLLRHGGTQHRVAWISHGAFFHFFVCVALGVQVTDQRNIWLSANNCSLSCLEFEDAKQPTRWIRYLNRLDFMPRELVTQ